MVHHGSPHVYLLLLLSLLCWILLLFQVSKYFRFLGLDSRNFSLPYLQSLMRWFLSYLMALNIIWNMMAANFIYLTQTSLNFRPIEASVFSISLLEYLIDTSNTSTMLNSWSSGISWYFHNAFYLRVLQLHPFIYLGVICDSSFFSPCIPSISKCNRLYPQKTSRI